MRGPTASVGGLRAPAWAGLWARRFCGDRRGVAAVEFAMVAAPFIFMIFALVELAMVFLVDVTLGAATAAEARCFRVGQCVVHGASDTSNVAAMKQAICANMTWGVLTTSCMSNLYVDVRQYSNFVNATGPSSPVNNGVFNANAMCDASGAQGTINVMTAYYQWKLFTPFLYGGLANMANGVALLQAREIMRFEPFGTSNQSNATC